MLAVQALRKMLEVARVVDAKDEARVKESNMKMNSLKKIKLNALLDTQPEDAETEQPKSDYRVEPRRGERTSYKDRTRRIGTRWSIGNTKGGGPIHDVGRTE